MRRVVLAALLVCTVIGARSLLAAPKNWVVLAPIPVVRAEILHEGDVHHLTLPPSSIHSSTVSLNRRQVLGDALNGKNRKNWVQATPNYRLKPDLAPYSADQIFTIPTPLRFASF